MAPTTPVLKATLLPHQVIGRDWCLSREAGGCILSDDMGLGKTVTTIGLMCAAPRKTLVIVPLSLITQWKAEIAKHAEGFQVCEYLGIQRRKIVGSEAWNTASVVLTTYGTVMNDIKFNGWEVPAFYSAAGFERLVLDEAHKVKDRESKTHEALTSLVTDIPFRLFLTGTPICNSEADLVSLFLLTSHEPYCDLEHWKQCITPDGHFALASVREAREQLVLYRVKEDVLTDKLPSLAINVVARPIKTSTEQAKYYGRMSAMKLCILAKIMRMRQSADDAALIPAKVVEMEGLEPTTEAGIKIYEMLRILDTIPEGEKVVVFSQWTTMLRCAQAAIGENAALMYHGGMKREEKAAAVKEFAERPEARVMLVSLKAGGYGLNLCMANHVIVLEPYFTYADEKQAMDRVYRIGQKRPVTVHKLWAAGSIEDWMMDLQNDKKQLAEKLL